MNHNALLKKLQLRIRAAKKERKLNLDNPSSEFWRGYIEATELARNDVLDDELNKRSEGWKSQHTESIEP